MTAKHSVTE